MLSAEDVRELEIVSIVVYLPEILNLRTSYSTQRYRWHA